MKFNTKSMRSTISIALFCICSYCGYSQDQTITSPDKKIVVTCRVDQMSYFISYDGNEVLRNSKLGLIREDEDFSRNLKLVRTSPAKQVKDGYTMLTAKKRNITYTATERIFETQTASGRKMNIVFRVSN